MIDAPKKLLIVSPHFPPIDAADMHRVRISLPFFREFGWEPVVLAVEPDAIERVRDPLLGQTVPHDVLLRSVRALPVAWTRKVGIGNLGLRALPFLYSAGTRLIRERGIDLVYFSTTQFLLMPLGRAWKRRLGVPFVIDMQDLWLSEYDTLHPRSVRLPKYALMRRLHGLLEPWTMRGVDGLIAVSPDYIGTLRSRYPWLESRPAAVLPFGASEDDFRVLRSNPRQNTLFRPGDGTAHGVYVGRGGSDMAPALRIAFGALARGLRERPDLFERVRLHFVGTSYASDNRARKSIEPLAEEAGVSARVEEHTGRVPYFDALQILLDADFLFVPGSDDPMYSPSKIYPYILARQPLIGVFRAGSPAVEVIRATRAGEVVEFEAGDGLGSAVTRFQQLWTSLLERLDSPEFDPEAFRPYSAREVTRRQCTLFDQVLAARARAARHRPDGSGMTGEAGTHMRAAKTAVAVPAEDVSSRQDLRGTRILVVMPSIPVLGMERANLQIMKMMRERGAEVLFVVNAFPGEKVAREVERMGFAWASAPVTERLRLPRTLQEAFALVSALIKGARAIGRINRKYRPTHIHLTSLPHFLYAAPVLLCTRCQVVLRLPNPPDRHLSGRKQALSDAVWRRIVDPLCDTIVCNSRFSHEELRATGLQGEKLKIIHNSVAERPDANRGDAPALDPRSFNIVFAGQLTQPKGIETLLRAARDLVVEYEEMRFYLAGWRSPYAEGLARDIEATGLSSRIHFVGEIDDVFGLLAKADLHVCPSIFEDPFPNVVLEAKSQGVPSVVFPSGGIPELVRHGVDGYVCAEKTADALRDGILYFFRNRDALRAAGDAARQSLTRFSPERISSQWAAVFQPSGTPSDHHAA